MSGCPRGGGVTTPSSIHPRLDESCTLLSVVSHRAMTNEEMYEWCIASYDYIHAWFRSVVLAHTMPCQPVLGNHKNLACFYCVWLPWEYTGLRAAAVNVCSSNCQRESQAGMCIPTRGRWWWWVYIESRL